MVKTLKRRFILISMMSVTAVLVLVMVGINIMNYHKVVRDADIVLDMIHEADEQLVMRTIRIINENDKSHPEDDGALRNVQVDVPAIYVYSPDDKPPAHDGFIPMHSLIILDDSENVVEVYGNLLFPGELSSDLAREVLDTGKSEGTIDDYRFRVSDREDGKRAVALVSIGEGIHGFYSFLKISTVVSVISLAVIAVIMLAVSDKAIRPMIESYEKQKRFITDAGHEIKTPLAIINSDADVLAMNIGSDNEWIEDIKKQTARMNKMTNDLILLSKMEEENINSQMEDIDLEETACGQMFFYRSAAEARDISMSIDSDEVHIKGDKKMIDQLMAILMDNAVKYCPDHGEIKIALRALGKNAVFDITNDTAVDVDDETIKHLFDRFYRADVSRNSETGGHGIGLSIAKAITDAHRGKINAVHDHEQRMTFTVSIPRVR